MSVFSIPSWLIAAIDKARRGFLWGTNQAGGSRVNLLSWKKVCLPKSVGGLGLKDLKLHNQAFLLRWLWRLYTVPSSVWTDMAGKLYAHARGSVSPLTWNKSGSFFWKDVRSLSYLFQLSTRVQLQGSMNTSFWFDNWGGSPLCWLLKGEDLPVRRRIGCKEALQSLHDFLPAPHTLVVSHRLSSLTTISDYPIPDEISWYWTSNGEFSVSSIYRALSTAGKSASPVLLWKLAIPPSVRLFLVLLSHDRILTRQQLSRRNIAQVVGCVLCNQPVMEDSSHLFFRCSFATNLWSLLLPSTMAPLPQHTSLEFKEALLSAFRSMRGRTASQTLFATGLWALWLERNNRVFRGSARGVHALASWILAESSSFLRHCG